MDLLLSVANRFGASSPTRFGQGMRIQRHRSVRWLRSAAKGKAIESSRVPHLLPKARIGSYPHRDPEICPACGLCLLGW
jgi:hypothetical protein